MSGSVAPESDLGKPADPDEAVRRGPLSSGKFSLLQLLGLTTLVAVDCVIGAAIGAVSLPAIIGLSLVTLNYLGLFRFAQTRHGRVASRWPIWLLFFASLWLPSLQGCNGRPLRGWELAVETVRAPIEMSNKLLDEEKVENPLEFVRGCWTITYVLSLAVNNLLIACLPLTLVSNAKHSDRPRCAWALAVFVPCTWLVGDPKEFLIGAYCWQAAALLALLTFPCSHRRLIASFVTTALMVSAMLFLPR